MVRTLLPRINSCLPVGYVLILPAENLSKTLTLTSAYSAVENRTVSTGRKFTVSVIETRFSIFGFSTTAGYSTYLFCRQRIYRHREPVLGPELRFLSPWVTVRTFLPAENLPSMS